MQRLLQLESADLYQLVHTKLDVDLFLDAIADLKQRQVGVMFASWWPGSPLLANTVTFRRPCWELPDFQSWQATVDATHEA